MSRQRHSLRFATAAAGVGIALVLSGCGAGQISQTAGMEPAVNGAEGDVGPVAVRNIQFAYTPHGAYEKDASVALTGALVNSAQSDDELVSVTSKAGQVEINGDKKLVAGRSLLIEVPAGGVPTSSSHASSASPATTTSAPTSGAATSGSATSGAATSGAATSGSATSGAATSGAVTSGAVTTTSRPATSAAPPALGKVTIVLTGLTEEIRSGKTVEVTFTFRSGSVTVPVPVAVPTTPRTPAAGGEGGGH